MDVTTEMRVELCVPPGLSGGAEVEFVVFDTLQRCHVPDGLCEGESFQVICDIDISEASCGGYCTKSAAWRMYNADELRCPRPEEGAAFYRGQHIEMRRSSGKMSSGVVLDILHAFETIYRCRIGDHSQTLEKHCTAADIGPVTPCPGFQYARGDMVRVARLSDGAVVLATVLEPTYVDGEPSYKLRLAPEGGVRGDGELSSSSQQTAAADADAVMAPVVETHAEEDIRLKTESAPGGAFYVGQLVQVRARPHHHPAGAGGERDASQEGEEFMQLARVCDMQVKAGRLAYLCEHVPDGWGFPAPA